MFDRDKPVQKNSIGEDSFGKNENPISAEQKRFYQKKNLLIILASALCGMLLSYSGAINLWNKRYAQYGEWDGTSPLWLIGMGLFGAIFGLLLVTQLENIDSSQK